MSTGTPISRATVRSLIKIAIYTAIVTSNKTMLFNASEFIYLFLPLTLLGYLLLRGEVITCSSRSLFSGNSLGAGWQKFLAAVVAILLMVIILQQWQKIAALTALAGLLGYLIYATPQDQASRLKYATLWLVICSITFYAWWRPVYLLLISLSIIINYSVGLKLSTLKAGSAQAKFGLWLGIAFNLGLIAFFKYAHFFVENLNALTSTNFNLIHIVLPLAISFFTFQQIAYLADAYYGETQECDFLNYCLFVTFFPQLIAGPIVHHKEMLPQFSKPLKREVHWDFLALGFTVFAIGLFKKAIIADGYAPEADGVFDGALNGAAITFIEGWAGALAYTVQLYFDFSGYSDMAIGLGLMFGIKLPLNFNSPYKARNMIEFWRRWHITLSRFLRDYLYIPLGGNRKGKGRRYINLSITMLLGGLWHGAAWTFVIWGGLHGFYLMINHGWQNLVRTHKISNYRLYKLTRWLYTPLAWLLTFIAIVIAWVFFRAESLGTAQNILAGMAGLNGLTVPEYWASHLGFLVPTLQNIGVNFGSYETIGAVTALIKLMFPLALVLLAPNTQQIIIRGTEHVKLSYKTITPWLENTFFWPIAKHFQWRIHDIWLLIIVGVSAYAAVGQSGVSQFLYFNF